MMIKKLEHPMEEEHTVGATPPRLDKATYRTVGGCPACWDDRLLKRCGEEGCNGMVHNEFGDEDYDMNYFLHEQCDTCGMAP